MENVEIKSKEEIIEEFKALVDKYSQAEEEIEALFFDQKLLVETSNVLAESAYDPFQLIPNDDWFVEDISLIQTIALGIYNFLFETKGVASTDQLVERIGELLDRTKHE
jgi:hypothetical protein